MNYNQQLGHNGSASPARSNTGFESSGFSSSAMFPSPTADMPMSQNEVSPFDAHSINNLRFLQNRQIGMMTPAGKPGFGFGMGEGADSMQLSTSAPISSTAINDCSSILEPSFGSHMGSRRLSEQLSGASGLRRSEPDKMDLDSALDELGMLSTVTNSRRQFLLEQRQRSPGHATLFSKSYWSSREKRLRSKSESSPNLTALENQSSGANASPANGYHIVKINTDFVTGFSNPSGHGSGFVKPSVYNHLEEDSNSSPLISKPSRSHYRNPDLLEESASRRRSIPRMSRFRKDRYRRSRCPYAIPNRLSSSMQESDFGPDYFDSCPTPFLSSKPPPTPAEEALTDRLSSSLSLSSTSPAAPSSQPLSKSNTSSPVKPTGQEVRLTRSLSAENLVVRRRLEQQLSGASPQLPVRERSSTERGLDLMTSQMTNLHMT